MNALEIYTKIMEITKDCDSGETRIALEFAQRKVNDEYYAKERAAGMALQGQLVGANYPQPNINYQAAREEVRSIVREVISESTPEDTEQAA